MPIEPAVFRHPGRLKNANASFIVRDANGQVLAYVYFEEEPGQQIGGIWFTG
jgi:hypothetical protein